MTGWFDEHEQRPEKLGQIEQQVNPLVTAGKVANNESALREPENHLEELLNGP